MSNYTAEILCLGNELLIGRTINKNATDIARYLTQEGFKVKRVTTVQDELEEARNALLGIIERHPAVLCITGGLGPTHDDIQLSVISRALNRPLELNQEAINMIKKKYKSMNEARQKMAFLPKESAPLPNSVGSAPGVITRVNRMSIYSLPGVPTEMKAIFKEGVIHDIREKYSFEQELVEFGLEIRGARESDITLLTDEVRKAYPNVNFKSHPKKDKTGYYLDLHTYAITTDEVTVKDALVAWRDLLDDKFNVEFEEIRNVFSKEFDGENTTI